MWEHAKQVCAEIIRAAGGEVWGSGRATQHARPQPARDGRMPVRQRPQALRDQPLRQMPRRAERSTCATRASSRSSPTRRRRSPSWRSRCAPANTSSRTFVIACIVASDDPLSADLSAGPGIADAARVACSCANWSTPYAHPFSGVGFTLQTPQREFASWLEISQDNGKSTGAHGRSLGTCAIAAARGARGSAGYGWCRPRKRRGRLRT